MNRKRKLFFSVLLAAFVCLSAWRCGSADELPAPDIAAEGAVVYCGNTGETVYEKNQYEELDPLSVTKLMTVLLAIQNLSMDQEVTVSSKAAHQAGSSMGLKEGETVKARDLIYGALLCSGNDAACALSEAVSGTEEKFAEMMNRTAANIGCRHTHFANASGIPCEGHYSAPYDMMQISKIALSNSMISEAAARGQYVAEKTGESEPRVLEGPMKDIRERFPGIYAGQLGSAGDSNMCIAFGYKRAGLSLWVVILNDRSSELENDMRKLLDYGEKKIEGIKVIGKDKRVGKVRVRRGVKTRIPVYTAETGYAYLPRQGSAALISTKVAVRDDVKAPVRKGEEVGTYRIYVAGELVNEVRLVAKENVRTGWFTSYFGISNRAAAVLGAVALIFLIIAIWITIVKARYRKRKRRLREEKIRRLAMEELRREKEYRDRDWRF